MRHHAIPFVALQPLGKTQVFRRYQGGMDNALHPDRMEPAERLDEVADILAAGLVRLNSRKSSHLSALGGESLLDCAAH